ncbi:hypothetical protein PVAP13_6NG267466 [Panicum virgatum]|uniref:Uncharacterized protein n=1 Tax=Panicum virgatum TaxID=38727 RepID=A0A8T0R1K2_PANVG|nr:hypothetical protein PVAP13_6NG267466 [Panicum virgatum]
MARRAAEQAQLGFAPGPIASGLVMMATINEAAGEVVRCAQRPARAHAATGEPLQMMRCEPTNGPAGSGGAMCAWRRRGRDADPSSSGATGDAAPRHGTGAWASPARARPPPPAGRGWSAVERAGDAIPCVMRRRASEVDGGGPCRGPTHAATETTVHATPCAAPARSAHAGAGAYGRAGGPRPNGTEQSRACGGHMWGRCAWSGLVTRRMFQSL